MLNSLIVNLNCHYATLDELNWLRGVGAALPREGQVVMIGAGPGVMLIATLEGGRELRAVVVDKGTCEYTQKHIQHAGLDGNLTCVVADSAEYGATWRGPEIDLLIVDGDHSQAGVERDCEAWLKWVKPNALIFFHDYDASDTEFGDQERYPGVKEAVDALDGVEVVRQIGTAMVMRKL